MTSPTAHRTRRAAWLGSLACLGLMPLIAGGCVPAQPPESRPDAAFELLHERKLSAFERELAMERHLTGPDSRSRMSWNRVGQAWLDLVNCTGLERADRPLDFADWSAGEEPVAKLAYATVVLEIRRQNEWALDTASRSSKTAFSEWFDRDFFDREPAPIDDSLVRWPGEEESWKDEGLAPVAVESECSTLDERLLAPPEDDDGEDGEDGEDGDIAPPEPDEVRQKWAAAQLDAAERVAELGAALPPEQARGNLALSIWRARVQGARVALDLGEPERGVRLLTPLSSKSDSHLSAATGELARMLFLRAKLRSAAGEDDDGDARDARRREALTDLRRALEIGLRPPNDERARYLALRLTTDAARWEEALEFAEPRPPRNSPLFEPFAYRVSLAARQSGAEDRFLRIAMETLAGSQSDESPFSSALYADTLALLAGYDFDARVVEMLEELGPASQIFRRVAQLSRVALEHGHVDNATAAADWLLARHHNHRYTPRYRGLLAIAAFMRDDEEDFREQVRAMTRRNPSVVEALGDGRQAEFFAHADRTFARLMGQMLPAMAEWGDDARAERRRQRWLEITIDETQRFLRNAERSEVHPELTELYGLASKLLEQHPRGYAARVGSKEPTPLVLGTVHVGRGDLIAHEPTITPSLPEPYLLTLVPRTDLLAESWSFGWADNQDNEQKSVQNDEQNGGRR